MDDWIDGITEYNENFRSFILAGHLEHENFDVDVVMQVGGDVFKTFIFYFTQTSLLGFCTSKYSCYHRNWTILWAILAKLW